MNCNNCGHSFYGNFCPKCGNKYQENYEKAETQQQNQQENPYNVYYNNNTNPNNYNNSQYYEPYYRQEQNETAPPINDETQNFKQHTPQNPSHCCFACPFLVCSRYHNPYGFYNAQPPVNAQPYYPVAEPEKKGWTPTKVILTVIASVVICSILLTVIPSLFLGATFSILEENYPYNNAQTGYSIGDTITDEDFTYTLKEFKEIPEYEQTKPEEGYKFVEVTFTAKNITDFTTATDCAINLYVDDTQIQPEDTSYFYDDILPDKYANLVAVFEIPVDSDSIEVCLTSYYSGSYMFTIK